MIGLVAQHGEEIAALCGRYGVARLELFGSAADGSFDPACSDIDFLVEFRPDEDLGPWLGKFTALKEALEKLLGRPVDLVMSQALRNPYFIREADRSRVTLYAA